MNRTLLSLSFFLIVSAATVAQDSQPTEKSTVQVKPLLTGSFEFGGDKVAEVYFTNGDTQPVKAGQGVSIGGGIQLGLGEKQRFLIRGTVGFKYVTTQANNVHIRLTRVPLILTANYLVTPKIRIAAGLVNHQAVKFNADGIGPNLTFNSASGPIFEIAYRGIGLSYTVMNYVDNNRDTYSANAIGVTLSGAFSKKK